MHCRHPPFSPLEFAIEAQTVAIEQCLAWQRKGACPADLFAQLTGQRAEGTMGWDQVAKALTGRWQRLRNRA